jgi:hypothetical protein
MLHKNSLTQVDNTACKVLKLAGEKTIFTVFQTNQWHHKKDMQYKSLTFNGIKATLN